MNEHDRILFASVPERCHASTAVGSAQNYIAEQEKNNFILREALRHICTVVGPSHEAYEIAMHALHVTSLHP